MSFKKILYFIIALVLTCVLFVTTFFISAFTYLNRPGPLNENSIIVVKKGMTVRDISILLAQKNIIDYEFLFLLIVSINQDGQNFKAGEYKFTKKIKPREIIRTLKEGRILIHKVTIPEGLSNNEIYNILESKKRLDGMISDHYPEGYLMPNTYHYTLGDSREALLNKMHKNSIEFLDREWLKRQKNLPLKSKREAMVLASIVEKEAMLKTELNRIAGVYTNRLQKKMKLQADPTVEFGITLGKRKLNRLLNRKDTKKINLYNTYQIFGLPPTPISNPGKNAIRATLNPEKHKYIFFVANGRGGHNFSVTYNQHLKNIAKLKKLIK